MPRDIRDLLQAGAARPTRPAPTRPVWRQGRRRRITKLAAAVAAVLVVVASSVAAATLLDGADAPEIFGEPDGPGGGSFEAALLDGTRLDLALPQEVSVNTRDVELAGSLYAADSLEEALGGSTGWRIDVVHGEIDEVMPDGERLRVPSASAATAARVDRSRGRVALQLGSWTVTASGDRLTDADIDTLLNGIDLTETPDGFVEFNGSLLLWVVDSPDLRLRGEDAVSVFLRSCSTPSADKTPEGLTVARVHDPNRGSHLTVLCDTERQVELWLDTAKQLSDDDLEDVQVRVLTVGSTLAAVQERHG